MRTVRAWPVSALPARLRCYVLLVSAAGAAAIGVSAALTTWRLGDGLLYGFLLAFGAVTVETIRRAGEPVGSPNKNAHGVWELAAAVLLPPFYALTAPVIVLALTQWRVGRTVAYRRVFSASAVGLSYGAASAAFHAAWHHPGLLPASGPMLALWLALAIGCGTLRFAVNYVLVFTAVRLDDPAVRVRDVLGGRDNLYNDAAELCMGALVAFAAGVSPFTLIAAVPCGMLLQRSASHAQLVHASRTDAKTGLLTAVAWQREASIQLTRAARARSPVAVAMVDIDHFKQVNDTYGHLAGDAVLAGVAAALTGGLREYDLAGRFGGEEFCLLLPDTGADEAMRVAERLRLILSRIAIPAQRADGDDPHITVSIGVAVLAPGIGDLTELLAAADAALYRAKRAGRNLVRLAGAPPPQAA
jgi:diguanylate cyclase (GGDEF)-like protein